MRKGRPRSRSTLIVLLLIAALAVTGVLAYEAQQAARSHRATAESVLRDYAAFAAWELTGLGRRELMRVINLEIQQLQQAIGSGGLQAAAGAHACTARCGAEHGLRTVFQATLPDAAFSLAGEPIPVAIREMVAESAAAVLRAPDEHACPVLRVSERDGVLAVAVWRPVFDRHDVPAGIVGFVSDDGFIASVFERLLHEAPLLPPSLVPPDANLNSALAVRVATAEGGPLFVSEGEWSAYESEQQLEAGLGELRLAVALRPDAAAGLVIGGLPRERLPLVLGLLVVTAGLVLVALVQLRREAELSRLRSDFVSGVSHELRTPLAQIRLFSETLLLGRVRSDNEAHRSLQVIAREAQRLAQLVENVLFFARAERRQPAIVREPTRLAPLISEVIESFAPLATARQARVVTELDETITAPIDVGAIRQILLNLLDNAVKYGPSGQTVTASLTLHGDRARLSVDDEGPGIDVGEAGRIWQPFDRLPRTAGATGGAGIGLAIVRQLTDLHGGHAWVERGPRGARFIVEIPGAWSACGAAIAVA